MDSTPCFRVQWPCESPAGAEGAPPLTSVEAWRPAGSGRTAEGRRTPDGGSSIRNPFGTSRPGSPAGPAEPRGAGSLRCWGSEQKTNPTPTPCGRAAHTRAHRSRRRAEHIRTRPARLAPLPEVLLARSGRPFPAPRPMRADTSLFPRSRVGGQDEGSEGDVESLRS